MNDLMVSKEVAHYLGIEMGTVKRWEKKGILKPIRIFYTKRYLREDIEKLEKDDYLYSR